MNIVSHIKRKSRITTFMIPYQLSIHKYICFLIGSFKTKINSLTDNQFLHCHGFPVPAFSPEITGDFIFCIFCIPSMRNGNVSPTGHIKVSSGRVSLKEGELPTIVDRRPCRQQSITSRLRLFFYIPYTYLIPLFRD